MPVELSEPYEVPGIGTCYFRKLEPVELHLLMMDLAGDHRRAWRLWPWMIAAAACDENGTPIFTKSDRPRLEALPAHLIEPMGRVASRFNGIEV